VIIVRAVLKTNLLALNPFDSNPFEPIREETDRAVQKANILEAAANEANERADKMEEKQRIFQKKLNEKVRAVKFIEI
jgi:hypothetical protein